MSRRLLPLFIAIIAIMIAINTNSLADVDAITFREIPWYSHPSTVSSAMESIPSISIPWFGSVIKNIKIEGWFKKWHYLYTDDAVDKGGAILKYSRVPIAGYNANVELSFMWSMNALLLNCFSISR